MESEEYDVQWNQALGNFPQAFTHIGYVNSVMSLLDAKQEKHSNAKAEDRGSSVDSMKRHLQTVWPNSCTMKTKKISSRTMQTT